MTNSSQLNLLSLAEQAKDNNDLPQAKQYLLEALRLGHDSKIVYELCKIYLTEDQADQAYILIKEEPDLFSDSKIFEMYLQILKKRHFNIEGLELENLLGHKLDIKIVPESSQKQIEIIKKFRSLVNITEQDYLQLFSLSEENFINLASSLLLDPSQNFALRLSLCEDLIKLSVNKEFDVFVLGERQAFNPSKTLLLEKDPIYREICVSLADYLRRDPSKLPLMVGEVNVVMGMLYPKLHDYIKDPDQFAHDFRIYIETKKGGSNQQLLDRIYKYLAYEKVKNEDF